MVELGESRRASGRDERRHAGRGRVLDAIWGTVAMTSNALPRRIKPQEAPRLLRHYLALDSNDRRMRFGKQISDDGLREYVSSIDLELDYVFAVEDDNLSLVGVAHLAMEEEHGHIGVSVLPEWRGRGIGEALVRRSLQRARNSKIKLVHMTSFVGNRPIAFLEQKLGFVVTTAGSEAEAEKPIAGLNICSLIAEGFDDWLAGLDHIQRVQHRRMSQRLRRRLNIDDQFAAKGTSDR